MSTSTDPMRGRLTLASKLFPQMSFGGTLHPVVAPWAMMEPKPESVVRYQESEWRREGMAMLEFLRKTNEKGEIIQWIKQEWKKAGDPEESLEEYANRVETRGQKLVAADMVWRLNDKYFGQWLSLHTPFRSLDDLMPAEVRAKVPERYQHFAAAMHLAPAHWTDESAIREEMQREAHRNAFVETVLSKVQAQRRLVERYMRGEIDRAEELPSDDEGAGGEEGLGRDEHGRPFRGTAAQKKLEHLVDTAVERSVRARDAENDEEYEAVIDEAAKSARIVAGMGPGGTGKTAVIDKAIRKWARRAGARVLFALPTGQLASRMRARHPDVDVDTCHGALLFHKELSEALAVLTQYDLVIIDEMSMLTAAQIDRVVAMWGAASRLPCLVVLGDFWQLPSADRNAEPADASKAWRFVRNVEFHELVRCKDRVLAEKLKAVRTSVPSKSLLRKICNRTPGPPPPPHR